ncbi:MAG: SAM-dependent methyltransferase [Kofleriaceae bacterium]
MHATARFATVVVALGLAVAGCKKKDQAAPAAGSNAAGSNAAAGSNVTPPPPPPVAASAITAAVTPAEAVAAADRPQADKDLDAGRKPAELLTFLKVGPGMKVAELFAGGGATVELLARVVGPTGTVYGQNTKEILEKFAEKPWSERLARLAAPSIVRVDRDLADPLPPEAHDLDLVVMHLVYHDTVWLGVDRAAMNAAIFKALKPGGEFAVIDHAAKDGAGLDVAKELHRIEAKTVLAEVTAAGFVIDRTSDMFAHPDDTRDWSASPAVAGDKRGMSDRFTLVFKKPVAP